MVLLPLEGAFAKLDLAQVPLLLERNELLGAWLVRVLVDVGASEARAPAVDNVAWLMRYGRFTEPVGALRGRALQPT